MTMMIEIELAELGIVSNDGHHYDNGHCVVVQLAFLLNGMEQYFFVIFVSFSA
jgi:hypothetical protein